MIKADLTFRNFHLITMKEGHGPYGLIQNGALIVTDGIIQWMGPDSDLPVEFNPGQVIDGNGRFMSPGLIDCHTHLIWAGSRADEWEQRLAGASYQEIARQGGGINSTVRATRATDEATLFANARDRIEFLMRQGVTTFEIKSGYGLDIESEQKMLRVATDLRDSMPVDIQRTFLGAHAVPCEFAGRSDEYLDLVCGPMMDSVQGLCDAVDVFCEQIAFDLRQTERVFQAAINRGLNFKVHADQLSNLGSSKLAAEMGGLSADHLEFLDNDSIQAMAKCGTVAVLLPGAFYFLRETQKPPVEKLQQAGVPIALASDANPGSSPMANMLLTLNLACTLFQMTPDQAMAGVTRNAAKALGLENRIGTLATGKQADLVAWNVNSPAELAYGIGHNPCHAVYKKGKVIVKNGQKNS